MYRFYCVFKRDFKNILINPIWFFYSVCFPILLVLIMSFISSGSYGSTIKSSDYYGITILIVSTGYTCTLSANAFLEEQIKSANLRIIFSPISDFTIYFSKILSTFLYSFCFHTLTIFILKFILSVNYGGGNIIHFIMLVFVFDFVSSALGILVCCITKSELVANQILSNFITIFSILGGMYFPIDGMGKVIKVLSYISPLKWISIAAFEIIYDQNFRLLIPIYLIAVIVFILALLLCKIKFKKESFL